MNELDRDFGTLDLEDIIREFGGGTDAELEEIPVELVTELQQIPEEPEQEPAREPDPEAIHEPVAEPDEPDEDDEDEYEDDEDEEDDEEEYEDEDEEEPVKEPVRKSEAAPKRKFSLFGAIAKLLDGGAEDEDDEEDDEYGEEAAEAPSETAAPEEQISEKQLPEEIPVPEKEKVTSDTIRLDDISQVIAEKAPAVTDETVRLESLDQVEIPTPAQQPETPENEEAGEAEKAEYDENEEEVEFVAPPIIQFRTKNRLGELRRQLVAGPEKRYYELSEIGVGKLQVAMLLCLVVILISGGAAALYAAGRVPENRLRLMIFGQVLAMLCGGLLGSQQMIEGVSDVFRGKFTPNTLLAVTFVVCCADSVFCLMELRVPICAAFTLEVLMSLWATYHKRITEMGQMDSLRKAVRLDSVVKVEEFREGKPGFLRGEGQVADFMEHYDETTNPEKHQNRYAMLCLIASVAIAAVAMVFHSVSMGFQILCTTLLVGMPASSFVTLTRPMAVLERKLHKMGTVLCGWSGVKGLCGKAAFALNDSDLFPGGSVKMNGVKFYGDRKPDETIAYAAALMRANGGTLAPIFEQLLTSRSGYIYDAVNLQHYGNGGIGGEVCEEPVLMGTLDFLKEMGVEIPEGTQVRQAVYVSIDGELSGLFAVTYNRMKYSASGIATLCSYRNITPVVVAEDFMITDAFLKEKFGVNTRRMVFPQREERAALAATQIPEETKALALTTQQGLAPAAYAITGARALRTASRLGLMIHIVGGLLGLLIMLALAIVGSTELLTPVHVLLYQLVWMIPGLLVTMWPRTI